MKPTVNRYPANPVVGLADVKPSKPDFEVMCAFNAGATLLPDGRTALLVRVAERPLPREGFVATALMDLEHPGELKSLYIPKNDPELDATDPRFFTWKGVFYLTSVSHLRLAVSDDGRNFKVCDKPALAPAAPHEVYGCEDPRITRLDDGWYYVNYSAIAPSGVTTCLSRTKDFAAFERMGIMFAPDNKDISIFPEKVGGSYACFHRPSTKQIGAPSMWLAFSDNLTDWGRHHLVLEPRAGFWDSERVGCGAAPIRTERGWLEFYHGANEKTRYCAGAVLLDFEQPWKVIARCGSPLLEPSAAPEMTGLLPGVIFSNGLVERNDGSVDLFYGAADTTTCVANVKIADVLEWLR